MKRKGLINILLLFIFLLILLLAPTIINNIFWTSILITVLINILLTSSLRFIKLTGHISLGHVGFSLIGAYCSALLVMKVGLSFWLTLFFSGLLAGVVALALSYPFLRVKGLYFIILTFLTAETFRVVAWYWESLTHGHLGLLRIPSPNPITVPGIIDINFKSVNNYYYLTLIIVCLSLYILFKLEHSHLGFKWNLINDADNLAQAIGINVSWYKMINFSIACFFAGISGVLFAHFQHGLSPHSSSAFGVMMSIYLLIYMIVGGEDNFFGPILGVITLTVFSELTRTLQEYQPMIFGSLAILITLIIPEGLIGLPDRISFWRRKLFKMHSYGLKD